VTFDGRRVWFAAGTALVAFDPETGDELRSLEVPARAGTAFDGRFLYQIADDRIQKIDPDSGAVLAVIPAPEGKNSGLTWAEGSLWVGQNQGKRILKLDPATGQVLHTIESDRFVTGVSFSEGEPWHGALGADRAELRRIEPDSGAVLERLELPEGFTLSGLEASPERFYCGGGGSRKVLAVKRPTRKRTG
jgi:streptogramin lyase